MFGSSKKDSIGVDIGTSSVKVVHLYLGGRKPVFKNFAIARLKKGSIQTSNQIIAGRQISKILSFTLTKSNIKSKHTSFSVPNFSSFVSFVTVPQMSEDELPKKLEEEARKFIPVPLTEVSLGWEVLKEPSADANGQMRILLMALANDTIKKYETIAKDSDLNLGTIEAENFALIRSLVNKNNQGTTLLLDIGSRICNIMVVSGGYLKGTRNIDVGGGDITAAISRGLNVDIVRSEAIKKESGMEDARTKDLILPILARIAEETKRMIGTYNEKNPNAKVSQAVIVGGTAKLKGFKEYLSKEINMPLKEGNPWSNVKFSSKQETIIRNFQDELAVAIGVAMGGA
jgi:type IV pilus assembly protein PilM